MLDLVSSVYSALDALNFSWLIWITLVAVFVLAALLSLREILAWYLKIHNLRRAIGRLQASVDQIEVSLEGLEKKIDASASTHAAQATKTADQKSAPPLVSSSQFPLQH